MCALKFNFSEGTSESPVDGTETVGLYSLMIQFNTQFLKKCLTSRVEVTNLT